MCGIITIVTLKHLHYSLHVHFHESQGTAYLMSEVSGKGLSS